MDQPTDLDLRIEYHSGIPVYRQIVNAVTAAVAAGTLVDGDRLPPIRQLSQRLDVNPNTVAKAYRELELAGVLETHGRNGSHISGRAAAAPAPVRSRADTHRLLDRIWATAVATARANHIPEAELHRFVGELAPPTDPPRRSR